MFLLPTLHGTQGVPVGVYVSEISHILGPLTFRHSSQMYSYADIGSHIVKTNRYVKI